MGSNSNCVIVGDAVQQQYQLEHRCSSTLDAISATFKDDSSILIICCWQRINSSRSAGKIHSMECSYAGEVGRWERGTAPGNFPLHVTIKIGRKTSKSSQSSVFVFFVTQASNASNSVLQASNVSCILLP